MNCPSRRAALLYNEAGTTYRNATTVTRAPKSDYAVNCGDQNRHQCTQPCIAGDNTPNAGPMTFPATPAAFPRTPVLETGISYRCSKVRVNDVLDGTTHTLCVGEKFLTIYDGTDTTDNESIYCGYVGQPIPAGSF